MSVSITQVSPSSTYAGPWVPVVLDVTTTNTTTYTYILATIGAQQVVVWGDGAWNPLFSQYSMRTELVAGTSYRYSILPNAGWRAGFTVDARAGEESIPAYTPTSQRFDSTSKFAAPVSGGGAVCNFERTDPFSFCFWTRRLTSGGQRTLLFKLGAASSWRGLNICWVGTNKIHFAINAQTHYIRTTLVEDLDDSWHHIGLTYDGSSAVGGMTTYVDGAPAAVTPEGTVLTATINASAVAFRAGRGDTAVNPANSRIMEILAFDAEISAADIAALYAAPGYTYSDLACYAHCVNHWRVGSLGGSYDVLEDKEGTAPKHLYAAAAVADDLSTVDVP